MRRLILTLCLSLFSVTAVAQGQTPLTNQDVIELHKAGFTPGLIIAKIFSSPTNFDTSVGALQELKKAGVPEGALLAVIQAGREKPSASKVHPAEPSQGRTRWEYRFESGPSEKKANDIGAEGWEFVAVQPAGPGAGSNAPTYIFKRARQ